MSRRTVTLRQIARRTGVHESTVSRALNARTRHLVADDVAARITATARDMGYRPNFLAAALRTRRTKLVAAIVDDLADPIQSAVIAGFERAMHDAGYATIVTVASGDPQSLVGPLADLDDRAVDGVLLFGPQLEDAEQEAVVVTSKDIPDPAIAGLALVVAHLVYLGHRRIGFLALPPGHAQAQARQAAFHKVMAEGRLTATMIAPCRDLTVAAGRQSTETLLAQNSELTALVAADDRLALGALDALAAHELRCPDDLSVTGIGDLFRVDHASPPLTTVRIDGREIGEIAATRMLARLDDGELASANDVTVKLRLRGSTAPLHAV